MNGAATSRWHHIRPLVLIVLAAATISASATACVRDGDEGAPPGESSSSFTRVSLPTTTTTAQIGASCVVRMLVAGVPSSEVDRQCAIEDLIDDLKASIHQRNDIAAAINAVRPGFAMTAKAVVDWAEYSCRVGGRAVAELVARIDPTSAQRPLLLSPLLDFATDATGICNGGEAFASDLSAAIWRETMAGRRAIDVLELQTRAPAFIIELLDGARSPCDLVGNAGVIAWKEWADKTPPKLLEFAISTFVGAVCDGLLEKLK